MEFTWDALLDFLRFAQDLPYGESPYVDASENDVCVDGWLRKQDLQAYLQSKDAGWATKATPRR